MKRIILTSVLVIIGIVSQAQIAKWILHPEYDSVELLDNGMFKVRQGKKFGLMSKDDKKILEIKYDSIADFSEGKALIFNTKDEVVGFTNEEGKVTNISGNGLQVINDYPYFSCGQVVLYGEGDYYLVNEKGELSQPYAYAQPFFYRRAAVRIYKDLLKKNDTYWAYMNSENGTVSPIRGFDNDGINFLSSISMGKSIVAYKKKFYEYDVKTGNTTLLVTDPANPKKTVVTAQGSEVQIVTRGSDNPGYSVMTKTAQFEFDEFMRLQKRRYKGEGDFKLFEIDEEEPIEYTTSLNAYSEIGGRLSGILFDNNEQLLPPQFNDVGELRNDMAVVKLRDKWGIIEMDRSNDFVFSIDDKDGVNRPIGFLHDHETVYLTLKMPPYIKANLASVVNEDKKCDISTVHRQQVENVETTAITYKCTLAIPEDITDNQEQEFTYDFSVKYDGLQSVKYPVKVKEWYIKNFKVERTKTTPSGSSITVEFTVTEERDISSGNYFREVTVETTDGSSVDSNPTKISETSYKSQIFGIEGTEVPFVVKIKEGKCPTIEYPFTLSTKTNTQTTSTTSSGQIRRVTPTAQPAVTTAQETRTMDATKINIRKPGTGRRNPPKTGRTTVKVTPPPTTTPVKPVQKPVW